MTTTKDITIKGAKKHRLYHTWQQMLRRTMTKTNHNYKHYGERGILVCSEWLKFENFVKDMYPSHQEGLSIDRIDNDGNYEPSNCRWSKNSTQARNTKLIRSTNNSGYRGVGASRTNGKWRSRIRVDKKEIHLGTFSTTLEAAIAYDNYVIKHNLEHTKNGVVDENKR